LKSISNRRIAALVLLLFSLKQAGAAPVRSPSEETSIHSSRSQRMLGINSQNPVEDTSLVKMGVLVTDSDGRPLSALKRDNFRVLDNGTPQKLVGFQPSSSPMTIVMLLESSAASYNYFSQKAGAWAEGFLKHVEPRDWIALTTFDLRSEVKVDFTHNGYEIREALSSLRAPRYNESDLFDAVISTLDKLEKVRGRTAVLLLATGANTFSSAGLNDVLQRLRTTDTTIFVVGLAEEEYVRYGGSSLTYLQAKSHLESFTRETGGIAFFPRFQGELPDVFRSVVGFLRSEYSLSFRPSPQARDGKPHRLTVEVIGADGKPLMVLDQKRRSRRVEVYTRAGYLAAKSAVR
jgi:VWFA-related protein